MDYTTAPGYVTDAEGRRQFADAQPGVAPGTSGVADDPNAWQNEIVNAIKQAGLTPDGGNHTQLWEAIASVVSAEAAARAAAIIAEAAARANADAALQTNLTAEATARANADSAEATARAAADGTLQTNLTAEATARANADSAEAATRAAADGTLQTNLTAEATARANADSAEAATRASADGTLQTNLTAEAAARANGDSAEAATRAAMDGALQARLDAISAGAGIANGHNYSWIVVNGYMSLSFTFENDATGTTQTIPLPKAFGGDITSVVINSMTKDNDVWVFNFTPTSFDMRTPNGGTNTFSAIAMGPAWSAS